MPPNLSKLDQLRQLSIVVADTGDMDAIKAYRPVDCTTNPTLVLKAAALPQYAGLVARAQQEFANGGGEAGDRIALATRHLSVAIGAEIAELVPGLISTEVDATFSYDTAKTIAEGRAIIADYAALGVLQHRILVKIAATWEGICAAKILQQEGINVNMTLVFTEIQAMACAEAGAFLISPFVGRVLDWHRQHENRDFAIDEHPGVRLVRAIHQAYRSQGVSTQIMAASFRSIAEIEALAGCDRLTIAPALLDELARSEGEMTGRIGAADVGQMSPHTITETQFHQVFDRNPMAVAKLDEGIRGFSADLKSLQTRLMQPKGALAQTV